MLRCGGGHAPSHGPCSHLRGTVPRPRPPRRRETCLGAVGLTLVQVSHLIPIAMATSSAGASPCRSWPSRSCGRPWCGAGSDWWSPSSQADSRSSGRSSWRQWASRCCAAAGRPLSSSRPPPGRSSRPRSHDRTSMVRLTASAARTTPAAPISSCETTTQGSACPHDDSTDARRSEREQPVRQPCGRGRLSRASRPRCRQRVDPGRRRLGRGPPGLEPRVDQRPVAVVHAESAEDVAAVVQFARRPRLPGRPPGHRPRRGAAGLARRDDPAQDLALARASRSTLQRRPRASRPACFGSRSTQAAAEHGLVGLAGSSPDVGVVGYSLGGGLSFLGAQARARREQHPRRRARHGRRPARPRRRRDRARPVLGRPRRRRQLRRRHGARDPPLPDHRGLRRIALLPDRARRRGARRMARVGRLGCPRS